MAYMTTCFSCKQEVSKFAKECPHCGAPKPATRPLGFMGTVLAIVLAVVIILLVANA
jgi:uncharacterized paraquat-inducible protein A